MMPEAFSSDKRVENDVPQVSSSIPLDAMSPVGRNMLAGKRARDAMLVEPCFLAEKQ